MSLYEDYINNISKPKEEIKAVKDLEKYVIEEVEPKKKQKSTFNKAMKQLEPPPRTMYFMKDDGKPRKKKIKVV